MIKAENVFKSFNGGAVEVLKGVSLEIEDGRFAVITGASGSGKSTLMNVLSGLERGNCTMQKYVPAILTWNAI